MIVDDNDLTKHEFVVDVQNRVEDLRGKVRYPNIYADKNWIRIGCTRISVAALKRVLGMHQQEFSKEEPERKLQ